jgi:hypothetical protein
MTGTVTATSLNLRGAPTTNGPIVAVLRSGTSVTILEQAGDWLQVSTGAGIGFLSAQFVKPDSAAAPVAPPPALLPQAAVPPRDDGTIRTDDDHAFAPDGSKFALKHREGFATIGTTTISTFLASAGASVAAIPPSKLRVAQAVSLNEGRLEAINSYDNSFMSFGAFQWTAGADGNPGELAGLMDRIKRRDHTGFQEYFMSFGLDAVITNQGKLPVGFLTLAGNRLDSPEAKTSLREGVWAYRFWRAGHDNTVRTCQIEHALTRIDAFYDATITLSDGGTARSVSKYITSEYGISLLLDEHVNRPGHVPGTLQRGISNYVTDTHRADPTAWTTDDERKVLEAYLQIRAGTSMTDSDSRAKMIAKSGHVSTERGSFVRS